MSSAGIGSICRFAPALAAAIVFVSGCASPRPVAVAPGHVPAAGTRFVVDEDQTAKGTVAGGAIGALAGTIVGHQLGERGGGALVGAATGALVGHIAGKERDRHEAAVHHALAAQALTNHDLIAMTAAGVGDEVILAAVNERGGRFDLSPAGIVGLKQSGVSEGVILGAQHASAAAARAAVTPPPVVVEQPVYGPDVVVVRPRPVRPRRRPGVAFGARF